MNMRENFLEQQQEKSSPLWKELQSVWSSPEALFSYLQEHHNEQENLTKEEKEKIAEHLLTILKQTSFYPKKGEPFFSAFNIIRSCAHKRGKDASAPIILDEIMVRMPKFLHESPEHAQELLGQLDQNPQILLTEPFIQTHINILYDTLLTPQEKTTGVHGMVYAISIGMDKALIQYLERMSTVEDQMKLLVFAETVAKVGRQMSFSQEASARIQEQLAVIQHSSPSALVRRKAHALLNKRTYTTIQSPFEESVIPLTKNSTPEEHARRIHAREVFRIFYDNDVMHGIEVDFGFSPKALSIREQLWFVAALEHCTAEQEQRMISHAKTFGVPGVKAFLSLEFHSNFAEQVLHIGETYPKEDAEKIFAQFVQLTQLAQNTAKEIAGVIHDFNANDPIALVDVEQKLLEQAKKTLNTDPKETIPQASHDIILFGILCKEMAKTPERFSLERFQETEIATCSGDALQEQDRDTMIAILKMNWLKQKPELIPMLSEQFREAVTKETTTFHVLKHKGNLVAFVRFDLREDGNLYCGSLHVDPRVQGEKIGEKFLQETLAQQIKNHTIYADVFPELVVGAKYVEVFGAVIYGVEDVKTSEGASFPRLLIRRDRESHAAYQGKKKPLNELATVTFTFPEDELLFIDYVRNVTASGKVISRYIITNAGKTRTVFAENEAQERTTSPTAKDNQTALAA